MSKKKTKVEATEKPVVKPIPASKIVEGADGRVSVNIYSPGHEPKEFRITITSITGKANLLHRSPDYVFEEIINGLRAKYGGRVG